MRLHEEQTVRLTCELFRSLVDDRIEQTLCSVEPQQLKQAMLHAARGGKMVRPLVTMLSASAVGGERTDALDAASAIEMLHISSLIHDDIMDDAPLRRGLPTVHNAFGVPMAILAGDTYIAVAMQLMHTVRSANGDRINKLFLGSFRNVCEGQGFDLCLSNLDCLEHGAHAKMVEKKTAKLLETAAAIGALTGTQNERHIHALSRFGYNLGMAFQAQDDLLDATGNELNMGKLPKIDVQNGRQTFLTLASPTSDTLAKAVRRTTSVVEEFTRTAISSLEALPPSEAREQLNLLANKLMSRAD